MLKINEKFQIRSVDPLNYGLYELTVVKGKDGTARPEWKHVGYFGKVSHALSSALNKYIKYLTEQEALDVRELVARLKEIEKGLARVDVICTAKAVPAKEAEDGTQGQAV